MATSIAFDIFARDRASDTFDKVGKSADGVGSKFKNLGLLAAGAVAGGAALAGKALIGMAKNAAEDEAASRRLAIALKNTTGATKSQVAGVESWISKMGVATGVTDDEMRPALQRLVQSTGDIGKAQNLMKLALDASAGSGKSLQTVSTALAKAQSGNLGALSRLGVRIKDVHGKTLSFTQVTKQMADTFGGQAAAKANSLDGKMQRLKLVFDETKESIGYKLLPVFEALATWFLTKGIPAISAFGSWLGDKLGPVFENIRAVVSRVTSGMHGDIGKDFGAIQSTIQSVASIITSLWNTFGSTILAFTVSTFRNLWTVIGGALQIISGIFKVFSSLLKGDWSGVWAGIKQILSGALTVIQGVLSQALNILKGLWRVGWLAIKGILGGIWDGITGLIHAGVDGVVNGIRSIPDRVKGLAGSFKSAGAHVIQAMVDGLKNAAGVISGIAGNVWDAVRSLLNGGIDKINAALEFKISLPGKDITVNPPNIPHLATGGIVTKPTLALIGEAGPEAVVPLSGRTSSAGVTNVYNVTVNGALDQNAVAKQVVAAITQLARTTGTKPLEGLV